MILVIEVSPDGLSLNIEESFKDWCGNYDEEFIAELSERKVTDRDLDLGGFGNLGLLDVKDQYCYEVGDSTYFFLSLKSDRTLRLKPKTKVVEYELDEAEVD